MKIVSPGVYELQYYSDKDKSLLVEFVQLYEESTDKIYVDGVIEFKDGITNEEVWYMMLLRYKELNDKHYYKSNDKIIEYIKEIIGETKMRKKIKYENKKKYEETLKSD